MENLTRINFGLKLHFSYGIDHLMKTDIIFSYKKEQEMS